MWYMYAGSIDLNMTASEVNSFLFLAHNNFCSGITILRYSETWDVINKQQSSTEEFLIKLLYKTFW